MPATFLKRYLPKNGMAWAPGVPRATRRQRIDARVVTALRSLGVSLTKRDVQIELTNLVEEAITLAKLVPTSLSDLDRTEFLAELHKRHRLGRFLSLDYFEQFFTTIVLARYRYISDRVDLDLPDEDPATHAPLAQAVDAFERAAWFWSTPEAFFEDDHIRAEEAQRLLSSSGGSDAEGSDGDDGDPAAAPTATTATTTAANTTTIADTSDPAYVSLAAGVEAMDLDDVAGGAGSEMDLDD